MRITARANAGRKVEGVMGDRRISRKLKRKGAQLVCYPGIHGCTRDDGTNRECCFSVNVQVCENNLVRRIVEGIVYC